MSKPALHEKAILLRKKGLSYSEIKLRVPVSRSTISLWLRDIVLTKNQKKRLYEKGVVSRALGSKALKEDRIKRTKEVVDKACLEVAKLIKKDLWLIGAILYWAEGHKQKEHNPSQRLVFSNSDQRMLRIYLRWLDECLDIAVERLTFDIYIHETYKKTNTELVDYWSDVTRIPKEKFKHIYIKKNKVRSYRKNRGKKYNGVLRISVRKSVDLNRKVIGWTKGICRQLKVV